MERFSHTILSHTSHWALKQFLSNLQFHGTLGMSNGTQLPSFQTGDGILTTSLNQGVRTKHPFCRKDSTLLNHKWMEVCTQHCPGQTKRKICPDYWLNPNRTGWKFAALRDGKGDNYCGSMRETNGRTCSWRRQTDRQQSGMPWLCMPGAHTCSHGGLEYWPLVCIQGTRWCCTNARVLPGCSFLSMLYRPKHRSGGLV